MKCRARREIGAPFFCGSDRGEVESRAAFFGFQREILACVGSAIGAAEVGDGLCNPFGWDVRVWGQLADGVDAGGADGGHHVGGDCAGAEANDGYACVGVFFVGDAGAVC